MKRTSIYSKATGSKQSKLSFEKIESNSDKIKEPNSKHPKLTFIANKETESTSEFDEIKKHLHEHGWAIVKGVVPVEKCNATVTEAWSWLESLDSERKLTRQQILKKDMPYAIHGIFQHYGIGHRNFQWNIRTDPGVIRVFEQIWNTNELLVSFDGINITIPGSNSKPWHHVDQGGKNPGFKCAQGLVNLLPN